jgi:putative transposase
MVALDLNLENVTAYDTSGRSRVYDMSEAVRAFQLYRRITSRFRRQDVRVKKRIFRKYARLAHDRSDWVLHNVSSTIVRKAKTESQSIVMEDLKGVREMYQKQSGSSSHYLFQMNTWPFSRLQRMVQYKAEMEGLSVTTVSAEGTSSRCSGCGGAMSDTQDDRTLRCGTCELVIDRDLNAAKNILKRALRSGAA